MNIPINKYGNIEIEKNILKFRMPISEFENTDIGSIEKNVKRKVVSLGESSNYLIPSQIESLNSSIIFYYQLDNYKSFDYIRQLRFNEKLKYFTSLLKIAKDNSTEVIWNKFNFVLDPYEEVLKAVIFETEDIKIAEKTNSLNGVKELILISLTKLERIYGKPVRADFIDQDVYIIQFAETILKIDNLEDLDHYINTKLIEQEHTELLPIDNVIIEKNPKEKTLPFYDKIINKLNSKNRNERKKNKDRVKSKSNKIIIVLSIMVLLVVLLRIFLPSPDQLAQSNFEGNEISPKESIASDNVPKETVEVTNSKYNDKLLEAYRYVLQDEETAAIKIIDSIGYSKLSKMDQKIVVNIYMERNLSYKIIELDPTKAKDIVNDLIANGKENEIKTIKDKLKVNNPYVDFEVSYLTQDWAQLLKLKDNVDLNGRKEKQIVEAYIGLNQFNEGLKFAESVGNPELVELVKAYVVK